MKPFVRVVECPVNCRMPVSTETIHEKVNVDQTELEFGLMHNMSVTKTYKCWFMTWKNRVSVKNIAV